MIETQTTWTTERIALLKNRIDAGALMRADRPRDRGESQRRHRQGQPARPVALQEANRRAAGADEHPKDCTAQGHHPVPDPPDIAGEAGACVRANAGQQRQPLLSVRTSAVALPLANQRAGRGRLRVLREQAGRRPTLLRGACPHGVSAGRPRAPRRHVNPYVASASRPIRSAEMCHCRTF